MHKTSGPPKWSHLVENSKPLKINALLLYMMRPNESSDVRLSIYIKKFVFFFVGLKRISLRKELNNTKPSRKEKKKV